MRTTSTQAAVIAGEEMESLLHRAAVTFMSPCSHEARTPSSEAASVNKHFESEVKANNPFHTFQQRLCPHRENCEYKPWDLQIEPQSTVCVFN